MFLSKHQKAEMRHLSHVIDVRTPAVSAESLHLVILGAKLPTFAFNPSKAPISPLRAFFPFCVVRCGHSFRASLRGAAASSP